MTVHELNTDQMNQLKEDMITRRLLQEDDTPSLGELIESHKMISDEEVFKEFDNYTFSEDDFWM